MDNKEIIKHVAPCTGIICYGIMIRSLFLLNAIYRVYTVSLGFIRRAWIRRKTLEPVDRCTWGHLVGQM